MTLQEIINRVNQFFTDEYDVNVIPAQEIIVFLNECSAMLQEIAAPEAEYTITVSAGDSEKNLPADFYSLISVKLNDIYLDFVELTDLGRTGYKIYNGKIILQPPASVDGTLKLHYLKKFTDFTLDNLNAEPEIPVPYHMVYVYYAAYRISQGEESIGNMRRDYAIRKDYYENFYMLYERLNAFMQVKRGNLDWEWLVADRW